MAKGVFNGIRPDRRMAGVIAVLAALGIVLWFGYVQLFDLGAGGIGTAAQTDTPVADSILDMDMLGRFTIIETRQDTPKSVQVKGKHYTIVELDSEERVLLRLRDGSDYPLAGEDGRYRYPIGAWVPLEVNDQTRIALAGQVPPLSSTTYYIDMEGNTGSALSPQGFAAAYICLCLVIGVFAAISYRTRRIDRRIEAVQAEHASSLPHDDRERWLVGTYAIWGQLQDHGNASEWEAEMLYIGGMPKDAATRKATLETLQKNWDITTREGLLETVAHMSEGDGFRKCQTQADRAWQLCRAEQLLGMGYLTGWLDRPEMVSRGCKIGKIIQTTFHSWEELCEAFLEAYAQWQLRSYPQEASANIHRRRAVYESLWNAPGTPYRLPWRLPL